MNIHKFICLYYNLINTINTLFNLRKILTSDLVEQCSSNTHLLPTIESIMHKSTINIVCLCVRTSTTEYNS